MKERPILFSSPMVRAILDGRKTQTRRVVKPQPATGQGMVNAGYCGDQNLWLRNGPCSNTDAAIEWRCPYGKVGDRLWVRESWRIGAWCEDDGSIAIDYLSSTPEKTPFITVPEDLEDYHGSSVFERYWKQSCNDCIKAGTKSNEDDRYYWDVGQSPCRIRPPIHMPRWASRITLEITDIRVERLQDISDEDAIDEGVQVSLGGMWCGSPHKAHGAPRQHNNPHTAFRDIWESIKGSGSWDANPWVWVLTFGRVM
jgi:hypothetical protein